MTGSFSTPGAGSAALACSLPLVWADAAAAANANSPNCLREYFMSISFRPLRSSTLYTAHAAMTTEPAKAPHSNQGNCPRPPFCGPLLRTQQPHDVVDVQIARSPPQSFARHRTALGEFHIASRCSIELRPLRQTGSVGIAGLGKIRPIKLHRRGEFAVRRSVVRAQISEHVGDFRAVRRPGRFPARRGAVELVLVPRISRRR